MVYWEEGRNRGRKWGGRKSVDVRDDELQSVTRIQSLNNQTPAVA